MIEPPVYCNVELTNSCNLSCVMCFNKKMRRPAGFMTREVFERVLGQMVDLGVLKVNLTTIGETFLHPKAEEYAAMCKDMGLFTLINTNLQACSVERIERMFQAGVDVFSISMEGVDKHGYEAVRQGGRYEDLFDNLEVVRQCKREQPNVEVVIRTVYPTNCDYSRENFENTWERYCDRFEFAISGNQGGYMGSYDSTESRRPCIMPFNAMSVTFDGRISFCCVDFEAELIVGDVFSSSLRDIWFGSGYAKLRRAHESCEFTNFPYCAKCSSTFMSWEKFPTIYGR